MVLNKTCISFEAVIFFTSSKHPSPYSHISAREHEAAGVYPRTGHQSVTGLTQTDSHTYTDIYRQFRVADLHVFGLWEQETHANIARTCKLHTERLSNSGHSCWEATEQILILLKHFLKNVFARRPEMSCYLKAPLEAHCTHRRTSQLERH